LKSKVLATWAFEKSKVHFDGHARKNVCKAEKFYRQAEIISLFFSGCAAKQP
jgi:hypothetical protein